MLSKADNDKLTQVGPGTPMGEKENRENGSWSACFRTSEATRLGGVPTRVAIPPTEQA